MPTPIADLCRNRPQHDRQSREQPQITFRFEAVGPAARDPPPHQAQHGLWTTRLPGFPRIMAQKMAGKAVLHHLFLLPPEDCHLFPADC
jgi:hypothetical protein